jgi:hypothetical protein
MHFSTSHDLRAPSCLFWEKNHTARLFIRPHWGQKFMPTLHCWGRVISKQFTFMSKASIWTLPDRSRYVGAVIVWPFFSLFYFGVFWPNIRLLVLFFSLFYFACHTLIIQAPISDYSYTHVACFISHSQHRVAYGWCYSNGHSYTQRERCVTAHVHSRIDEAIHVWRHMT